VSVRSGLGAVRRRVLCSMYRRDVPLGIRGPIVSFSFDDFPRSAYTAGGAILEQFGVRGTYYTAIGLMNTSNELGEHFSADDLDSLVARGHELASHTFSHVSCRSVSAATFRAEVEKGRKALSKVTGQYRANFAYPFGHVTLQAKKTLGTVLPSARSVIPGFNGPEIDLNLLRANSLYGDLEGAGRVEKLILENTKRKNWLIFYTHDVRPKPSAYGCTPELLQMAVSCAVLGGCRILTVREVLAEVRVQNGNRKGHARPHVHL
jgi:peptidoglycan/xylan/chitin deacetylase (PgdA/CDA1 family)